MKKRKINLRRTAQVKDFNKALRKGSKINHVVKHEDGWAVKKSGARRASKVFSTRDAAINNARGMARKSRSGVVIHGRDGRIRRVKSYD